MMKICFFDTHSFEKNYFIRENAEYHFEFVFIEARLSPFTAPLAKDCECVCAFTSDNLQAESLKILKSNGTRLIALRSAGFSHVDLHAAEELDLPVVRVPEYSPYAVAEYTIALIQTLNRKTHKAYNRVREGNFSLDGLIGFDLHEKTVGVIGVGRIGKALINILKGFGCHVLAYDINPDFDFARNVQCKYCGLDELLTQSDIISLNVPLNNQTKHLLNEKTLAKTKKGIKIINTGRGALIDTRALIQFLKNGHIGFAGLDVYEEEENYFFHDLSQHVLDDDILARLLTFPNVLLTGHQGFLTQEALSNIARTTLFNVNEFVTGKKLANQVRAS